MKNSRLKKVAASSLSALLFSFFSSPINAQGAIPVFMDLCLMPYVGFDGQIRAADFESGFGSNMFKKNYPEANFYVGLKFNDYIGIEGGYKISTTETQTSSLGGGNAAGIPVNFPPEVHRGTASFKGWHGDLVGYLPIMLPNVVYLLGSIGFNRVEFYGKDKLVQNQSGIAPPTAFAENVGVHTFNKTQTILTLGTGIQVQLDEKSSLRFKLGYENTSGMKTIISKENPNSIIKLRDSFTYGIGFVINFL